MKTCSQIVIALINLSFRFLHVQSQFPQETKTIQEIEIETFLPLRARFITECYLLLSETHKELKPAIRVHSFQIFRIATCKNHILET